MLDSIEKIKNPQLRGVAAAGLAFTVVTFISGIAISAVNPKAKANQVAAPSYFIGMACGALFGFVYTKKISELDSIQDRSSTQTYDGKARQDWRNFVVVRKVKESEEITSFYLKPEDKGNIPKFQAGQFISIKLDVPEQEQPVIRPYSISDYPEPCDYYRISTKRELAPKGLDAPPGVASNFMHDHIQTGAVIPIKPPSGQFILDIHKSLPVVLISNGIGITPLISIAKACSRLKPKRTIWFVHGARNGQTHAFRDEVLAIAQENPNLHVHFRYSHPRPEDKGHYDSVGHVDTELIKTLVGQDAQFYLCGSPPFLESLQKGLKEWGVPKNRVFHESFYERSKALSESQSFGEAATKEVDQSEIVFAKSGKTLTWHYDDGTILEFAEANGLHPPYSCRQGICGTCMCKIREGSVAYQISPTAEIDEDSVLICISKPATPKVVLDV
jgi:ferredoxin-NADP reductase